MRDDLKRKRCGTSAAFSTRPEYDGLQPGEYTPGPTGGTYDPAADRMRYAGRDFYLAVMGDRPPPEYPGVRVGALFRISIRPWRWMIEINDVSFMVTTKQLLRGPADRRFRGIFEYLRVAPRPHVPASTWDVVVQDRLWRGCNL
jgi:hypothetical protein